MQCLLEEQLSQKLRAPFCLVGIGCDGRHSQLRVGRLQSFGLLISGAQWRNDNRFFVLLLDS
jgi:hypothetical protein